MTKKLKRWLLAGGLMSTIFFLSGCMRIDSAGNPQGWMSNLIYNYLVVPTEISLEFFAELTGSYGLAIIIITLLIRVILLPLTLKQQKSMMENQYKMSTITPVANEIQADLKATSDPATKQELQAELMALYQENNVNFMGQLTGCLPIFIQMPIFIAILHVLRNSENIFNASFLGIQLGQPSILLAILTGAIHYFHAKLSTQRLPQQAQKQSGMMTMIMPLMMLMMTFSAPAGFALYFFVGGIVAVLEQLITNNYYKPKIEADLKAKHGEQKVVQRKKKENKASQQTSEETDTSNQKIIDEAPKKQSSTGQKRRRNEGKQQNRR